MSRIWRKIIIALGGAALLSGLYGAIMLFLVRAPAPAVSTPAPMPPPTPIDYTGLLRISEIMGKNHVTLPDRNNEYHDYIELENYGETTVSLSGWSLSDHAGKAKWSFPHIFLDPGEYLVVFCGGEGTLNAPFSLSWGETVCLIDPAGETVSSLEYLLDQADTAMALGEDGEFHETLWPTPGFPNTREGYAQFCASVSPAGPLVINEAMTANSKYALRSDIGNAEDWVELKNISDSPVDLAGWHLSDKYGELSLYALPGGTLQPEETLLIYCAKVVDAGTDMLCAPFALSAVGESLFLSRPDGSLADCVYLHDIPADGSMGRMDGENGFFYFTTPSPNGANANGLRFVSETPTATADGVYNDIESLSVELYAPGDIHYTDDGSLPTEDSPLYTGPLTLSRTSVIRAIAREAGGLWSPVATYSYIINESHTLPVLSLAVDSRADFNRIYNTPIKYQEVSANAALYDGDSSFNHRCAVSMKGWTSLNLYKKNMGIRFGGIYGGDLNCDVFGNGITRYSSLSIRAGQDYSRSVFRNELIGELALEMSDKLYTQYSKFCILYINGEYYGIYCLKEDFFRQYFASRNNVDKDSVTMYRTPVSASSDFKQEVLQYSQTHDFIQAESYEYICGKIDVDSLIDWLIIEGYSANTDVQGNARVFRSTENGGKWYFAAYDFDWGFYFPDVDFVLIFQQWGNAGNQLPPLIKNLMRNPDFRQRFLTRFSQANRTVLSNEHVVEKIDYLAALLEPEIPRDRQRWNCSVKTWYARVQGLRDFVLDNNWEVHNVQMLKRLLFLTDQEMAEYFPHLEN